MVDKKKIAAVLSAAAMVTLVGAGAAQAQAGPPRPAHCTDTDSTGNENSEAKYVAAVCKGEVYVLTVDESAAPPAPVGGWERVGGPSRVTDVSLASNTSDVEGGPVFITVLTKRGEVWEGTCPDTVPLGECTFTQLPRPPH